VIFFVLLLSFISMGDGSKPPINGASPNANNTPQQYAEEAKASAKKLKKVLKKQKRLKQK
ncbi:hypothetical protein QQA44_06110, partial [Sneathia vaginalis]|uniref:hypothetical protein n=1 Tax=Sneathia vaginalis TaxID=187101 RepID=UPI002550CB48